MPVDPRAALEAVLLFHSGGPWTHERRTRWQFLTGYAEATTKILCDVVREALRGMESTP
jgi:hypothetical protein